MINIDHIETWGWEAAFRGLRNPLNSWAKSDSFFDELLIGKNDLDLAKRLIKAGSEHRKFLRMIHVQMDVIAPLYWWKEADTYKVGTTTNSCSTMHKIAAKEFALDDFSHEHLMRDAEGWNIEEEYAEGESPLAILEYTIAVLNFYRKKYLKTKDKKYWWQMIQLLPSSYNQRRTWDMSMETLLSILHQRKNHKLDEWQEFCRICKEKIPYCNTFYEAMKGNTNEQDKD